MFPILTIKNFKGIKEAQFELAPITLLLGANSSGKTTVLEAIRSLTKQRKIEDNYELFKGAEYGEIKLELPGKEEIEEIQIEIPSSSDREYLDEECVYYLSSVREPVKRTTEVQELSLRTGIRGENTLKAIIADLVWHTKKKGETIIDKINRYLEQIGMEFLYEPDIEIFSASGKVNFRLKVKENGISVDLVDTGFGYTQLLHVATFIITAGWGVEEEKPVFMLIEEPSVHLHPKLSAGIMDIIIGESIERIKKGLTFSYVIETHSEHVLIRLRRRIAEGRIEPENVRIYFFEKEKGICFARRIEIDERGELSDLFPADFFSQDYEDLQAIVETWRKKWQQ